MSDLPILYSFRRCPYAMRARYVLVTLGIPVQLREVVLKNKPDALLSLGGRSTVPQLVDTNGKRYEESMDIINWALQNKSAKHAMSLSPTDKQSRIHAWLFQNDMRFKPWLDKYKYSDRHPAFTEKYYRNQGERFLRRLERSLRSTSYLLGDSITLADIIVFPFVRQFRGVNSNWFDASEYHQVKIWLNRLIESENFIRIMAKHLPWQPEDDNFVILK